MPSQTIARRLSFALAAGAVTALAVVLPATVASRAAAADRSSGATAQATAWSERTADALTRHLDERRRDIELLAGLPDIVHAARLATAEAKRRGLQRRPVAVLERELDASRALSKDPRVAATLAAWRQAFGFAELSFTERDGYSVLGTERVPDFVQSDEDWWQRAFAEGFSETAPQYHQSLGVTIELAVRITDPATHQPMGVIKATLALADLKAVVLQGAPRSANVELVDATRRIILSPDSARLLREVPESLPPLSHRVTTLGNAVAAPAHGGRWWVVTRVGPGQADDGDARTLFESAGAAAAVVFVMMLLALGWSDRRRLSGAGRSPRPGSLPS